MPVVVCLSHYSLLPVQNPPICLQSNPFLGFCHLLICIFCSTAWVNDWWGLQQVELVFVLCSIPDVCRNLGFCSLNFSTGNLDPTSLGNLLVPKPLKSYATSANLILGPSKRRPSSSRDVSSFYYIALSTFPRFSWIPPKTTTTFNYDTTINRRNIETK